MSDTAGRVVLAYSGGLDTSVILKWLVNRGHEVVAYVADVGQEEDFDRVRDKALASGASSVRVEDLKQEFVTDFIYPAFKANAIYEGCYLLGTALARPLIARKQIEIAHEEQAPYVSHGATGKGNDQVRFELAYYALDPVDPGHLALEGPGVPRALPRPARAAGLRRRARHPGHRLARQALQRGRQPAAHQPRVGHPRGPGPRAGRGDLLPHHRAGSGARPADADPHRLQGRPALARREPGRRHDRRGPLPLFTYLNRLGSENGIGRLDLVENRFVGVKSRGIYETPGGTILHVAHRDIEGIAMDREVRRLRDMLSSKLSEVIYNGFWFSPEMDFLMAAIDKSQEVIDGSVRLKLYKGNVTVVGRESTSSLYDRDLSSMDIEGGFDQKDSEGFIKINAIRLMAHNAIMKKKHHRWGVE